MKKHLLLIGLGGFLLSSAALAEVAVLQLTVDGELLASTCTFEIQDGAGTGISTLTLPDIREADVYPLTEGEAAGPLFAQNFNLDFTACSNTNNAEVSLVGATSTGPAAVGLEINVFNGAIIFDSAILVDVSSGAGSQALNTNYTRTAAENVDFVEGTIARVFDFTVEYL